MGVVGFVGLDEPGEGVGTREAFLDDVIRVKVRTTAAVVYEYTRRLT